MNHTFLAQALQTQCAVGSDAGRVAVVLTSSQAAVGHGRTHRGRQEQLALREANDRLIRTQPDRGQRLSDRAVGEPASASCGDPAPAGSISPEYAMKQASATHRHLPAQSRWRG